MTTDPMTDNDLAELRRSAETAFAACTGPSLWRTVAEGTLALLDEIARIREDR